MKSKNNLRNGSITFATTAAIIIILAIIGLGYFIIKKQPTVVGNESETNITNQIPDEEKLEDKTINNIKEDIIQKETDKTVKYTGAILGGTSSPLLDFNKADYDLALKSDKLIVLYFYANWCPICRKEFPEMQTAFNQLTTDGTIGFRINYKDNQTDNDEVNLAREFAVTYQHTKIFLKNGQKILKSLESWDKNRYLNEIENN